MPVTAKLSRKFHERFGDELTNELVEWFNLVDATYRSDLRELNEVNFGRFDAKLEQRLAELEAKLERWISELRVEIREEIGKARNELHAFESRLIHWMFLFWIGQAATTVGLVFGVVKIVQK